MRRLIVLFSFFVFVATEESERRVVSINEDWVCNVKTSCMECLRLSQCSWCPSENKCFSTKLPLFEDFCKNDTVLFKDYGLSNEKNAECACAAELENNCRAESDSGAPECSGRGTCQCGRCLCDPAPDPDHPTKTIVGEYCEFDNFSCDGPDCDEGPYPLSPPEDSETEMKFTL